ncbi:TcmI family type II polyketide cyclase [Amycolatopsis sp. NPDC059657]|uniref:TcmI family type II polyketide cyclase n=1 Tax=Amycolatopsis sp. NPDC059657 TaxID=3346899 RepID=UPI003670814C
MRTLIVARMAPGSGEDVAGIFEEFDRSEMPGIMGTKRRELFSYQGLYFHLQDFDGDGPQSIEQARTHPLFVAVSADLKPHISPFDPETWRSPADALATSFYQWEAP